MARKMVGAAPSNTLDFVNRGWAFLNFVSLGLITAKGDLLAGDGAGSVLNVGVGANGTVLMADSATSSGVGWRPANRYIGVNAQTGTTYTPVLSDEGKLVTLTNAGAITVTMPQDSSVAIPIGGSIDFVVRGAGMATFVAGTGVSPIEATPSAVTRAQYSGVTATKVAANTWWIVGDLA